MRVLASHAPAVALLTVLTSLAACGRPDALERDAAGRLEDATVAPIASPACDSAWAARVALDSLARLDHFRSEAYRFAADAAGARIVTWPGPANRVLDGMAVVRLDGACHIISLVQTDSA